MARKLIIVQFLGLLIMVSCGDRGKSLYPLRESEKWTYQAVPDSAMNANARMIVTNMPERKLNGKSVTPQKTEANGQTFFSFVGEDSEGVFVLASQGPNSAGPVVVTPPPYLLRRPYEKGTKWEVKSSGQTSPIGGQVTLQTAIQGTDETVTVPAGTFEGCLKVAAQGVQVKKNLDPFWGPTRISLEQLSWFCPGVGLVKSINKIKSSNRLTTDQSGGFSLQLESHESK